MVKPVSGFMTKFDRFFESELEAILNETEFILKEKLEQTDLISADNISTLFDLLAAYNEEFIAYLTAARRALNGKENPPRTTQGKSHRTTRIPPPNV